MSTVEQPAADPAAERDALAGEVQRLRELVAGFPERWTAKDEAERLAVAAEQTREYLLLRDMRERGRQIAAPASGFLGVEQSIARYILGELT